MKRQSSILALLSVVLLGLGAYANAQTRAVATSPAQGKKDEEQIKGEILERSVQMIENATAALDNLRFEEQTCYECYAGAAGAMALTLPDASAEAAKKKCIATWSDFYSKSEIDIRYVFGYGDASGDSVVDDDLARQTFVDQVLSSCDTNVRVCGFTRSKDDADLFEKTVLGPTGKNHRIKLRLTASSYSQSDVVNREFFLEQEKASEDAKRVFYSGIEEADMLMYVGHARDGGGPDFSPAKRRSDGRIDYAYYTKNKPGIEELTKVLAEASKTPKILGFLACNSERWLERLERMAPNSGLLLNSTDKIAAEAALAQSYAALDSVLWQRCEKAFDGSMNQFKSYADRELKPISLRRYFNRKPTP